MLFLQGWFWAFAAIALPLYWVCPSRLKLYWLVCASLVFQYHFAGPAGMAPIILLATITYVTGLWIAARRGGGFGLSCTVLVGALAFYKYSGFIVRSAVGFANALGWELAEPSWQLPPAAPLAISFFTFEFIHYLYEIRFAGGQPIRNPVSFSVFAVFFPSLACGPIKRYPDFVPQLAHLHTPVPLELLAALQRLIRGLFKKICIADLLVEWIKVFESGPRFTAPVVACLAVLQGFRIYYDFAGYSDIAIALAQMMGLRIPENFNRPYWSTSLREFWRRWHMSLSSWIRDYIYIPLGGNRAHRAVNLATAMLLCGLWHGAAWHFAAWGGYHGLGLAVESVVRRWQPRWFAEGRPERALRWLVCYCYVAYGWLIFFYPLRTVLTMTRALLIWS